MSGKHGALGGAASIWNVAEAAGALLLYVGVAAAAASRGGGGTISGRSNPLEDLDFLGDFAGGILEELPALILAVALIALCVWLLRRAWALIPRRGAEVVR
jgi:hypothetical protein